MKAEHKTEFKKCLDLVKLRMQKAEHELHRIETGLENKDEVGVFDAALDFADAQEKVTLAARSLPTYTPCHGAIKIVENRRLGSVPVKIGFTKEGWFCAIIPSLLPKKEKGSPAYIRDILNPAMNNFFRGKDPVLFTRCALIIRHVYNRKRPEREYRDHDNIEVNMVVDIMALHVMHDDSPLLCEHHYYSMCGEQDETQIFVVPQGEFVNWILAVNNSENKEILLFEKPKK